MAEIHTKKHLEKHPELATQESTHESTHAMPTEVAKKSFFSGVLFKVIIVLAILGAFVGYVIFQFQKVIVDNPSTENITIKIDNKEYIIEARKSLIVNAGAGKHTLSVAGKDELNSEFERTPLWSLENLVAIDNFISGKHPIINPLQHNYVLDFKIYSTKSTSNTTLPKPQIINTVYIPLQWNYGLNEDFPKTVSMSRRGSQETIRKKIFRFSDYAKYANATEEELIDFFKGDDMIPYTK